LKTSKHGVCPPEITAGGGLTAAVKTGSMDSSSVLGGAADYCQQTAALVCAPGGMVDEVTKQVAGCASDGLRVDMAEKLFAPSQDLPCSGEGQRGIT